MVINRCQCKLVWFLLLHTKEVFCAKRHQTRASSFISLSCELRLKRDTICTQLRPPAVNIFPYRNEYRTCTLLSRKAHGRGTVTFFHFEEKPIGTVVQQLNSSSFESSAMPSTNFVCIELLCFDRRPPECGKLLAPSFMRYTFSCTNNGKNIKCLIGV